MTDSGDFWDCTATKFILLSGQSHSVTLSLCFKLRIVDCMTARSSSFLSFVFRRMTDHFV
jgi:hypothetical protein